MGTDKIRYLVFLQNRWRWRPTKAMRAMGFRLITFGPTLTEADKIAAIRLNSEWDKARRGGGGIEAPRFPPGSVGDGYVRAMGMRAEGRRLAKTEWTSEHSSRDDWPRAWRWIGPAFGDFDPRTIPPEMMQAFRATVVECISESEAHRVIKIWRALWKRMAVMGYCERERDPSLATPNTAPAPRAHLWTDHEVKRLVQGAWRAGYAGLAACMAVAWDSQLSPVDVRTLTPAQRLRDGQGSYFDVARAKTGRAAAATLSQWSEAILDHYVAGLGFILIDSAPIFRTRAISATEGGGRPWAPRPYTKDKLGKDFATVRALVFGATERRQLADMRRSGTVEAFAGGASAGSVSTKMANTLSASSRLQKTYNPVEVATVRQVDNARTVGRARMREQKATQSVTSMEGKVSQPSAKTAQVLEVNGGSDGARTRDLRRDRPAL